MAIKYIIKSGAGYLCRLSIATPLMITDPVLAKRFDDGESANRALACLYAQGFGGELVQLRLGNMPNLC